MSQEAVRLRFAACPTAAIMLCLTFATAAIALPRAVVVSEVPAVLSVELEVLPDPSGTRTIDQVSAPATDAGFGKSPATAVDIKQHRVYWVRFRLDNPQPRARDVLIRPGPWNDARLFSPSANGFVQRHSGLTVPDAKRDDRVVYLGIDVPTFFLETHLPPASSTTHYLRLESDYRFNTPDSLSLAVHDAPTLRAAERGSLLYQGIFLGAVLALCLYNLALFVLIRDASYAYYVLHLMGIWIIWASNYNITIERVWPAWPVWDFYAINLAALMASTGLIQFARHYLDTPRTLPRMEIMLRVVLGSQLLLLVVFAIVPYRLGLDAINMFGPVVFLASLATAIAAVRIAHPLAMYFLAANLCTSIGHFIFFCALFEVIPRNYFNVHAGELGVALEGILLSLGLAYRIRRLREELAERSIAEERLKRQQDDERRMLIEHQNVELERKVIARTADLSEERERAEALLRNILPVTVADELKRSGRTEPRRFEEVSILFTDFADFTQTVGTIPAKRMVEELNEIFAGFDDIVDLHGLEKIKTIGDAYMAAAGLPEAAADHALRCVRAALDMTRFIDERNREASIKWGLRAGIHSGPVVAGVVGKRKYAYDIWGDTVNIASRMESAGEPGRVNLSAYTYDLVRSRFDCEYRGKVSAKGKGEIDMYYVLRERDTGKPN